MTASTDARARGRLGRRAVASLCLLQIAAGCGLGCDRNRNHDIESVPNPPFFETSATHATTSPWPQPKTILLILIDTLRSDFVGAFGSSRELTPHLDALAERSFVFEHAVATSSWTRPSVASLLTSRYPTSLGVLDREHALADRYVTLAETLQDAGWATIGIYTNGNTSPQFGFAQGFEHYVEPHIKNSYPEGHEMLVAQGVTELALEILANPREWRGERPLFLFLHFTDPHEPYLMHPESLTQPGRLGGSQRDLKELGQREKDGTDTQEDRERIVNLYAGEVRYCDQWIGRLFEGIEELGLTEETLVLVTSDHGEGLWDHGSRGHGGDLHEEQIRVPLILHQPGMSAREARRITAPVSLVDVAPTLLRAARLPALPSYEGTDLGALTSESERAPSYGYIFSELTLDGKDQESIRRGSLKLIRGRRPEHFGDRIGWKTRLFDLNRDPEEHNDLSNFVLPGADQRHLDRALDLWTTALASRHEGGKTVELESLDAKTRQALIGLGYIEAD